MRMMIFAVALVVVIFCTSAIARQADYDQDIVLTTTGGKIEGSLLMPANGVKPPVVLIIAGSGATDRDGNTVGLKGKNDSLKMLAASMAQAGVASVRFDKRGIAGSAEAVTSAASEADLRFETYVQDAVAWIRLLKADVRFSGVAMLGHSEGSLIAMLAAQQEAVKAYISVAGPAKNAADVLRWQLQGKLSPALAASNEEILSALQAGKTYAEVPPELKILYRASVQPYLISWFRYTPEKEIAKLTCPVLLIQGDKDIQVDTAQLTALKLAKPDAESLLIHNMNHVLKIIVNDTTQQMASYTDPALPLAPELTKGLNSFLLDRLKSNLRSNVKSNLMTSRLPYKAMP
ncbi:alpha/beta hydrolase family protein [Undibacterium sp. TC4M20W]|uniref:alpha/beta hydrolase family protein n=1 Tax=unclassified Undibacterium TaxID=2630295 RepID=UPI003BF38C45